jgi:cAMP phosphodiesterase
MKVQMLPSTIDEGGRVSARQHLMSVIIDDRVAIDAGSLAFSCSEVQRRDVRDIVLTHTHLDHIAGLPLFIDDLFATLQEPITVHATPEMIEILERDIFNWAVYPRFSELSNGNCSVVRYSEFEPGSSFTVKHLDVTSVPVNHKVSASGYIVSDGSAAIGITGDTAETDDIWSVLNKTPNLKAVLVECAFPNDLGELASVSNHLTPQKLEQEIGKLENDACKVYVINIKPMYRDRVLSELAELKCRPLEVLEIGMVYDF